MDTQEKQLILPLSGVESEHCALIVDKGLEKVNGIISHKVELNNHQGNRRSGRRTGNITKNSFSHQRFGL